MLNAIVRFSLRFRGVVFALAVALLGYGVYTLGRAKYDVFPEFAPPVVAIQTEAPGLSPEQIELLVTTPIELAINGLPDLASVRSGSIQGLSAITVTFKQGTDIYRDRQVIAERLASLAGRLPQGVKAPTMTPLTSSTATILAIGLTSERRSLMELRTIADWTVRLQLQSVPGVASVVVFGGDVKQFQIQLDPERLIQYNVSIDDVLQAAQKATSVVGAGFVEGPNQRLVLQSQAQATTTQQLAGTVILHHNGVSLTLGQLARVVEGPEPPFGAAAIEGVPGVQLIVEAQYGANTLEVTQGVERVITGLRPSLEQQGIHVTADVFRAANFIQTALGNIRSSLMLGAILVIVVLFIFLFDIRTATISCTAIPLSLLAAVVVLDRWGLTLNTMTLGGLAIALGEVVDDAVIDVENIFRRLRENRQLDHPRPPLRVALDASIEVRSAVVYATLVVVLVFVPILTMSGVAGRIFAPLGIAYILAILASLVVALTVTPALTYLLLGRRTLREHEPPVVEWLKARYRRILLDIERTPRAVIATVAALTVAGIAVLPLFSVSFLPQLSEGHFILHMAAVPGTSLATSLRIGQRVTEALRRIPTVRLVGQTVGRAEVSAEVLGTHDSEFDVDLKPDLSEVEAESTQGHIREALAPFLGVNFSLNTFLTERIDEILSGYRAAVVINLFGSDLDALDRTAREVSRVLSGVPNASEVTMQSPPGTPQIAVEARPADVARWGFDSVTVLDAIHTAFNGTTVGQVYQGNQVFDVEVILPPTSRRSLTDISALPLKNPDGRYVSLGQVTTVYETSGRYIVLHDGARRVQTITLNVAGGSTDTFVADARRAIAEQIQLPPGVSVEFGGTAAAQAASTRDLLLHSALVGVAIVALLSIVMMNGRNLLLVLANIPFALVGGVLAVFATGGLLSLGPLVGFVTLFGITLRNSIMLVSHYEHLIAVEGMEWGLDAAMRGAGERLAPILMTATVTGLGLLPLAIGSGAPGREIEGPMAIVILGGLVTSTALNLLVLPTLALRYGRFEKPQADVLQP
jgi:CzcA family heavy metal efflux pump